MRATVVAKRRGDATAEQRVARIINSSYEPMVRYTTTPGAQRAIAARQAGVLLNDMPFTDWMHSLGAVRAPLRTQISNAVVEASRGVSGGVRVPMSFDVVDAISVRYAEEQAARMIREITETQRSTIRHIIANTLTGQDTMETAAAKVRQSIGLHQRWADAVVKVHDRRFTELLAEGKSPEAAAAGAERTSGQYRKRLLRVRSQNIARTEIQRASNIGIYASWETAVGQGFASNDSRKEWDAGPGACPICAPLSGVVVRWDQEFPNGSLMPPAHPSCRCTSNLLPPEYGDDDLDPRRIDQLNPDAGGQLLDGYAGRTDIAPARALAPWERLAADYAEGFSVSQHLSGGSMAESVELGTLPSGEQVVRKVSKTVAEADTEYLAHRMFHAIGGEGIITAKVGRREVVTQFIDGETGMGWRSRLRMEWRDRLPVGVEPAELGGVFGMRNGREIGLLDWLLRNEDRHSGNYLIKNDTVFPIDHGYSGWRKRSDGLGGETFGSGEFAYRHVGVKLDGVPDESRPWRTPTVVGLDPASGSYTKAELLERRANLAALKDDFKGHQDWFEFVMESMDDLIGAYK